MISKTISMKRLKKNAEALGVIAKKEYREKKFMAALIMAAVVLSISVGLIFITEALKKLLERIK